MQAPALDVLLEPRTQARPLAQQRLVGDLHRALADRHQPVVGEHVEDLRHTLSLQLVEGHAPPHDGVALAASRQAQENAARDVAAVGIQSLVGTLGQACDRAAHAACLLVGVHTNAPAVTLLPQLQQRRRQQRQRSGFVPDVGDQGVDEVGLDVEGRALRRELDRAAQLVAAHRADEQVVGVEQRRQLGVGRTAAVEVGADGNEHE